MAPRPDEKAEAEDDRSRTGRIKDFAYEKTPEKLKNATDLQVRFRTGFVYVALSVLCILVSDWTTVAFLVATAGITAGEFYYMLRSDAKLPNEMLGIIAAMLYPLSVFLLGLNGALYVSLALLLALIVWYVFWMRARVPDVGVSFFGAAYCGMLLSGLVVVRTALPQPWGGVLAGHLPQRMANDCSPIWWEASSAKAARAPRRRRAEGSLRGSGIGRVLVLDDPHSRRDDVHPQAMAFGLISGLMGVLGDLAESTSQFGFKDLAHHAGSRRLLDRCDSLFLVAVTSAILLLGFGCIPFPVPLI
ncbi:MAG: phosphatidate cytidylyltransferase [Eggerthella lenta]